MGGHPPIPVDPIQTLPPAVLHQTPGGGNVQPLQPVTQQPVYYQPQPVLGPGSPGVQQSQPMSFGYPPSQDPSHQQQPQYQQQPGTHPQQPQQTPHVQPLQPQHTATMGQSHYNPQQQPLQPQYTATSYLQVPGGAPAPTSQHAQQPVMATVLVPQPVPVAVGVPQPVFANQPIPQQPMGMPTGQQGPPAGVRSVPHRPTALPSDQPPQRAGTVYGHPTGDHKQHHREGHDSPRTGKHSHIHGGTRAPADSYLDRVDHDPRVQAMLAGTRNKTVHSSAYPASSHQGHDRNRSVSAPGTEKPLPPPNSATRAHTTKQQSSRAGTAPSGRGRRFSLMDDLHGQHVRNEIRDGDRYPPFPRHTPMTRGHSGQDSINSTDPAQYALPM